MTITVAALKRALEESFHLCPEFTQERFTFDALLKSPAALTILAERLSVRPFAGNKVTKVWVDEDRRMPYPDESDDDYQRRVSGT